MWPSKYVPEEATITAYLIIPREWLKKYLTYQLIYSLMQSSQNAGLGSAHAYILFFQQRLIANTDAYLHSHTLGSIYSIQLIQLVSAHLSSSASRLRYVSEAASVDNNLHS